MTEGRPPIPAEIKRQVLVDAGHRCAVCGNPCPLELAHIVPWRHAKEHKPENLICLCANCHQRADNEGWGEKTLKEYKRKPWIFRNDGKPETNPLLTSEIELTINMELEQFDELHQLWLQYAIAAFLNIPPCNVRIVSFKKTNSITITVAIPDQTAEKLIQAYKTHSPDLSAYLSPFGLLAIRWKEQSDSLQWHVIHTLPEQEDRAESNLKAWNIETFSPKYKESRRRKHSEGLIFIIKPLFPRYIFARFNKDLFHKVKFTRGIVSIVSLGSVPVTIGGNIVTMIQSQMDSNGFIVFDDKFTFDETLKASDPIRYFSYIFNPNLGDSERVIILLDFLNQIYLKDVKEAPEARASEGRNKKL